MTPRRFIIGVCSFSESHRKRACRETWMRDSTRYSDLELVFFEGNGTAASREGDVVRLPVPDDYRSLFTKVTSFLSYCLDRYEFEYLFKCDDDTYVHLPRL